jgi:hypothetical protein
MYQLSSPKDKKQLTLCLSSKHHSLDHSTGTETSTENLDDSNGIDIEVFWVLWHDGQSGFGSEGTEEFLGTGLLGCDRWSDSGSELGDGG